MKCTLYKGNITITHAVREGQACVT